MRGRRGKALRVSVAVTVAVMSGLLLTAGDAVAEAGGAGAGVDVGAAAAAATGAAVGRDADVRRSLVLTGDALSIADIIEVARRGRPVEISPKARARVAVTFEVVLAAARAHLPVYGLTTGVGWNKDKDALQAAEALDPDLMAASQRFNLGTLRAHAAGVGEPQRRIVVEISDLVLLDGVDTV